MLPDYRVKVSDDEIIKEARKRYERASAAAQKNKNRYREAMQFVAGDQWDQQLAATRQSQMRPVLTMDRLGTHINQIVNDQRQSKPAIKVHPVDDKADVKTAEIYNGLIRNIEHISNAPMAYETAAFTQVAGGQGAWRVLTRYADDDGFDQEIFIKRILDPMSVTWDPDAKEMDGSDGKFVFIEDSYSREAFEEEYPDVVHTDWPGENDPSGWWSSDSVRCAEYYRLVNRETTLYMLSNGSVVEREEAENAAIDPTQIVSVRQARRREVQWFKLGGNSVIDSRIWPGRYLPVVRVVGNEQCIDGEIQYTGLTHRAMDPARMYNYQASVMVEMLALQKTAPWIGAKGQFKGMEQKWARSNNSNAAYLEYEPVDINGQLAPPPMRQPSPQVPTGNVQAMASAAQDLQWITGQHAANFGAASNETSGRAINARQREGDTATYHYLDNMARGILATGRILVDIIPHVYDTKRVLRILGDDETASVVQHSPDIERAMVEIRGDSGVQRIYNLGVGRYDVAVSVGPSFGTLRQESVEAMQAMLSSKPELWQAIGDIFVRRQNWPGAQEIADRLAKMVPRELKNEESEEDGEDQSAQIAQASQVAMQMQEIIAQRDQSLQQAQSIISQASQRIDELERKLIDVQSDIDINTRREEIKAGAEIEKARASVEVARLEAEAAIASAEKDTLIAKVSELKDYVSRATEIDSDGSLQHEKVEIEALKRSQESIASSIAALAHSLNDSGGKRIKFIRGIDNKLSGAVVVNDNEYIPPGSKRIEFVRGDDGSMSGAVVSSESNGCV